MSDDVRDQASRGGPENKKTIEKERFDLEFGFGEDKGGKFLLQTIQKTEFFKVEGCDPDQYDYTKLALLFLLYTETASPEDKVMFLFHAMYDEVADLIHEQNHPHQITGVNNGHAKKVIEILTTISSKITAQILKEVS